MLIASARQTRADLDSSYWSASLETSGTYTSNVFFKTSPRDGDFFGTYKPQLTVAPDVAFGKFSLAAGLVAFTYLDHDELNRVFPNVAANMEVRLGRRARFRVSDRFTSAPLVFTQPANSAVNLTSINTTRGSIEYDMPVSGRSTLTVSGGMGTTQLLSLDNDSYDYAFTLDFTRQLSARLNLTFGSAFMQMRFLESVSQGIPLHTFSRETNTATLNYRTGPRLFTRVTGGVSIVWVAGRTVVAPTGGISFRWLPTERLTLSVEQAYLEQVDTEGDAIRYLSTSGRVFYKLTPRITARAVPTFAQTETLVKNVPAILPVGDASMVSVDTGLSLALRKELTASLGYQYTEGFGSTSFLVHTVEIKLGLNL